MSLSHNPSIVTDGLVFAYDMGNGKKSWKGKPTTNVIQTDLTLYDKDNGCTVELLTTTFQGAPVYRVTFPAAALPRIRTTFAYTTGQQFTGSIYYRVVAQGSKIPGLFFRENGFGTTYANISLSSQTWTQASITHTFSGSGTCMFLLYQSDISATIPTVIDFAMPQSELNSFATPFVNGTRSNTQAVLDWTGNNTITANSLTYNADGTFSFASTSNYVSVGYNSGIDLVNTVTLEAWLKYTTSTNTVCIEKSNNNTHYQFQIFASNQGAGIGGDIVFMLQPNASNWVTAGLALNDNQWHHVVGTYDRTTTTARIYVDGLLRNTNSSISTGPTTNTQPLLIGSRSGTSGFGGTIPVVKIYNRALTTGEVQQNFQALRGRYGL